MPLTSDSIIVGGGVEFVLPITVGRIPRVASVGPPGSLFNSELRQWTDGVVNVITVGTTNVRAGVGVTETFRLRGGLISEGAANDSFVAGRNASVSGSLNVGSIAIGWDALCTGPAAIAIGGGGSFSDDHGVAIGYAAFADDNGVALGYNAFGDGNGVTIGAESLGADGAIAIGYQAQAYDFDDIILGNIVALSGTNGAIVIGNRAVVSLDFGGVDCLVIGNDASIGAPGQNSLVAIAIGNRSVAWGEDIVLGHGSASQTVSVGAANIIIGHGSTTTGNQNIMLGGGLATTRSQTAFVGSPTTDILTVVIGGGDTAIAPPARDVRFTNGSGLNDAAGAVQIIAPLGTGSAVSASLTLCVGAPVGAGAGLHTVLPAVRAAFSAVAGETGLVIFDVNTGAMQRVLVGAAGTGPSGVGRGLYLA